MQLTSDPSPLSILYFYFKEPPHRYAVVYIESRWFADSVRWIADGSFTGQAIETLARAKGRKFIQHDGSRVRHLQAPECGRP
jgi:hypothetical protein